VLLAVEGKRKGGEEGGRRGVRVCSPSLSQGTEWGTLPLSFSHSTRLPLKRFGRNVAIEIKQPSRLRGAGPPPWWQRLVQTRAERYLVLRPLLPHLQPDAVPEWPVPAPGSISSPDAAAGESRNCRQAACHQAPERTGMEVGIGSHCSRLPSLVCWGHGTTFAAGEQAWEV